MKGGPETEHLHQWFMRFAVVADGAAAVAALAFSLHLARWRL